MNSPLHSPPLAPQVSGPTVVHLTRALGHASRTRAHRLYSSLGFRPSDTTVFRLDAGSLETHRRTPHQIPRAASPHRRPTAISRRTPEQREMCPADEELAIVGRRWLRRSRPLGARG